MRFRTVRVLKGSLSPLSPAQLYGPAHRLHLVNADINVATRFTAADFVDNMPVSTQPFMKLIRFDRPIGSWLLFWPCGWGVAMATDPGHLPDPALLTAFAAGSILMRGAGCTINDMWDADLDREVKRTQDRPITSGQLSRFDALVFLGCQLGLSSLLLLRFDWHTVVLAASSIGLVVAYPAMKRFTHWPQLVLGLTFNWGALVGWSAVHGSCNWSVCLPLYSAGVFWTLIYDTIYAHQDKRDDIAIGLKSTALRLGNQTKAWLSGFNAAMMSGLVLSGFFCGQTWPHYVAVGLTTAHVARQISTLDIDNPDNCGRKFRSNRRVGLIVFLGILAGTVMKDPPWHPLQNR